MWAGRILSGLLVALLLFSAVIKFIGGPQFDEGFTTLGYNPKLAPVIGAVEVVCTLLYAIPQTSVLGAILLTGYLGGATATHLRMGEASLVMPVIIGVVMWVALYLRDKRLRELAPWRRLP